ncbi:MAG: nucleotidyltransferase domain-containing protein [Lachnospiraceae bacterium]|nr:nucleotidyltransferase domain-containing protein [Lachnospiraceae bacterium]
MNAVILYGSYARGDYSTSSDVDIMILLNLSETEIKKYRHQLSEITFDFNMDYDMDIKPIAKSNEQFMKWLESYPFYQNIQKEGVILYRAA